MAAHKITNYERLVKPKFDQIRTWRSEGFTEIQISQLLGVSYAQLREYKKKFPAFSAVLTVSKAELVANLEASLYQRAMGIKWTETKTKSENGVETEIVTTNKFLPPDTPALMFSLKNLDPEKWREKQENVNTNLNYEMPASTIPSDDEIDRILSRQKENGGGS